MPLVFVQPQLSILWTPSFWDLKEAKYCYLTLYKKFRNNRAFTFCEEDGSENNQKQQPRHCDYNGCNGLAAAASTTITRLIASRSKAIDHRKMCRACNRQSVQLIIDGTYIAQVY